MISKLFRSDPRVSPPITEITSRSGRSIAATKRVAMFSVPPQDMPKSLTAGVGQHLGQQVAQGRPDDHLHVAAVHRGRGDIGLPQAEAGAQRGLQFGAGGEGGVEGDAHEAPRRAPRTAPC